METAERELRARLLAGIHGSLLAALIVFRPLVWDGDAASPANLVYLALIILALLVLTGEIAGGLRSHLRWSWLGLAFAGLVGACLPVALHAPIAADGATWWWQLVLHLGLGAYLLQIVPGRERLAWTALMTGLVGEVLIGWIQGLYVLPVMAVATAHGDIGVVAEGVSAADLGERITNGGWFGTFTLSNSLAAWLLVAAVPLVTYLRRPWTATYLVGSGLFAGAMGLFLATKSKGALLALMLIGGVWWWRQFPDRRWRWLPVPALILGMALVWSLPQVQAGLQASARVRLGYWQGAWTLVRESPWTGLGWGAFAERSSTVMPLWAEPSRLVHNEPLELAVAGGIPLALVLVALLVAVAWPRRRDAVASEADDAVPWAAALTVAGLCTYLGLLGMFTGNVGWWPGGDTIVGQALWSVLLGAGLAFALRTMRLPLPPGWCFRVALAALGVHCLIDFNLHSFAVIGTLLVVAVLASGQRRETGCGRLVGWSLISLTLAMGFGALTWASSALAQRELQDEIRELRLVTDPEHAEEALAVLALERGQPAPAVGDRRAADALVKTVIADLLARTANDPQVTLQLCVFMPPGADRAAQLDRLRPLMPFSSLLARLRANDFVHVGDWGAAVAELRRSLSLAPASQQLRQELISLLERAVRQDPSRAARWQSERDAVAAERERLEPVVDFRNRSQAR